MACYSFGMAFNRNPKCLMCALVQPWTPIRMYQYRYMVDIDWTYAYLCKFESFLFDICVMSGFLYCFFIYCFRCTICVLLCALCVGKENHINSNASVVFCVCVCAGGGIGGSLHNTHSLATWWWKDSQRSEPFKIHTSTFMAQKFVLWVF